MAAAAALAPCQWLWPTVQILFFALPVPLTWSARDSAALLSLSRRGQWASASWCGGPLRAAAVAAGDRQPGLLIPTCWSTGMLVIQVRGGTRPSAWVTQTRWPWHRSSWSWVIDPGRTLRLSLSLRPQPSSPTVTCRPASKPPALAAYCIIWAGLQDSRKQSESPLFTGIGGGNHLACKLNVLLRAARKRVLFFGLSVKLKCWM